MSDLEDLGLVISPHTSAGRIPTPRGYRLFVDTMLTVESAADDDKAKPAMESLGRMGPKIIADLRKAADKTTGQGQFRLMQLLAELTPPDPVMKSTDEEDRK